MSRLYILVVIICFSLNVHTQSAEDLNRRGLRNYQHGDYDAAVADFSKAIDAATRLAPETSAIARSEGLTGHARAMDERGGRP